MYAECATVADVVQKEIRIDATEYRSQRYYDIDFIRCYILVSGVVLCCCIAVLKEVLSLDDGSYCITAGRCRCASPRVYTVYMCCHQHISVNQNDRNRFKCKSVNALI